MGMGQTYRKILLAWKIPRHYGCSYSFSHHLAASSHFASFTGMHIPLPRDGPQLIITREVLRRAVGSLFSVTNKIPTPQLRTYSLGPCGNDYVDCEGACQYEA